MKLPKSHDLGVAVPVGVGVFVGGGRTRSERQVKREEIQIRYVTIKRQIDTVEWTRRVITISCFFGERTTTINKGGGNNNTNNNTTNNRVRRRWKEEEHERDGKPERKE